MNGVIEEHVRQTYFPKGGKFARLEHYLPIIYRLHEWFLGRRQSRRDRSVPKGYLRLPEFRVAYLLYFAQLNALRFRGMCRQMLQRPGAKNLLNDILGRERLRILDLGCGPGSAAWGWLYFLAEAFPDRLKELRLEINLADQSGPILNDAHTLLQPLGTEVAELKAIRRRFDFAREQPRGRFDLIFLSYTLNEFSSDSVRQQLISQLIAKNLDRGLLLILEPAQSTLGKHLISLRDRLLEDDLPLKVVSPCLHQGGCPLSSGRLKDFCHFSTSYQSNLGDNFVRIRQYLRSREAAEIRAEGEKYLNYCSLILTNHEFNLPKPSPSQRLVISGPLSQTKEGTQHRLCYPSKGRFIVSKEELKRGDLV